MMMAQDCILISIRQDLCAWDHGVRFSCCLKMGEGEVVPGSFLAMLIPWVRNGSAHSLVADFADPTVIEGLPHLLFSSSRPLWRRVGRQWNKLFWLWGADCRTRFGQNIWIHCHWGWLMNFMDWRGWETWCWEGFRWCRNWPEHTLLRCFYFTGSTPRDCYTWVRRPLSLQLLGWSRGKSYK